MHRQEKERERARNIRCCFLFCVLLSFCLLGWCTRSACRKSRNLLKGRYKEANEIFLKAEAVDWVSGHVVPPHHYKHVSVFPLQRGVLTGELLRFRFFFLFLFRLAVKKKRARSRAAAGARVRSRGMRSQEEKRRTKKKKEEEPIRRPSLLYAAACIPIAA